MTKHTALNLTAAAQLGTDMAVQGWSEAQVVTWCQAGGWSRTGMSCQRILRAYRSQVARG